jgi:hypothetical protein
MNVTFETEYDKAHSAFHVKKGINMSELENGNGGGSTRSFG